MLTALYAKPQPSLPDRGVRSIRICCASGPASGRTRSGRSVSPDEGEVSHQRPFGMTVWYTSLGFADMKPGRELLPASLCFVAGLGLLELFENSRCKSADQHLPGALALWAELVDL